MTASLIISIISAFIAMIAVIITEKNSRPWLKLDIDRTKLQNNAGHGIKLVLTNLGQSPLKIEWNKSEFFKGHYYYLTFEGNQNSILLNKPNKKSLESLVLFPNVSTTVNMKLYSCNDHIEYRSTLVSLSDNIASINDEIRNINITIFYSWPTSFFRFLRFNTKMIFSIKRNNIDDCEIVNTR
ncbi:hypothetical protein [Legionella worsleiensis]|uniref:Uncharacterized protein n=1 Tax=Legionella worsleiensis TaxID=45076 RepID=A0A0W1A342_9GAMM|nr:hypothetical protein [Legionella worsleiensis]KTD75765.1 hypothetical protein Lwor_2331 [Legionella worsleiensis]STY32782.1 Uncharacterised protein [Legionella worsleiensis]